MFKTVDDPRGRIERWLAPEPVVRAVEILERLSLPLREASGRRELFLVKNPHGAIVSVTGDNISVRIRRFAAYVGVPHHEGKPWPFSPHQFRKTFARFIARRDRSQLFALADHGRSISFSPAIGWPGAWASALWRRMPPFAAAPVSKSDATTSRLYSQRPIFAFTPATTAGECSSPRRRAAAVSPHQARRLAARPVAVVVAETIGADEALVSLICGQRFTRDWTQPLIEALRRDLGFRLEQFVCEPPTGIEH
jgi:hypothetical protein